MNFPNSHYIGGGGVDGGLLLRDSSKTAKIQFMFCIVHSSWYGRRHRYLSLQ